MQARVASHTQHWRSFMHNQRHHTYAYSMHTKWRYTNLMVISERMYKWLKNRTIDTCVLYRTSITSGHTLTHQGVALDSYLWQLQHRDPSCAPMLVAEKSVVLQVRHLQGEKNIWSLQTGFCRCQNFGGTNQIGECLTITFTFCIGQMIENENKNRFAS